VGGVWLIHHHRSCRTRELPSYLPPPACTRFPTHHPPPATTARPPLPLLYTGHRTHSPLQGIALPSPGPQPATTKHRTEPAVAPPSTSRCCRWSLLVVGRWRSAVGHITPLIMPRRPPRAGFVVVVGARTTTLMDSMRNANDHHADVFTCSVFFISCCSGRRATVELCTGSSERRDRPVDQSMR
jgi:hypothetical protein